MIITTRTLLWGGLIVSLFAWPSLVILTGFARPTRWNVVLALELTFVAVTALAVTVLAFIFRMRGKDYPRRVLREGVLIGLVVVLLLALQYLRLLTWIIALGLVLVFLLLEGLFLYRERRHQKTPAPAAERPEVRPRPRARRERKTPSS